MASNRRTVAVGDIAYARSGDKGSDANVGVWAHTQAGFEILKAELTTDAVLAHFEALGPTGVIRYELDNLRGLNFMLTDGLGGSASASLRTDAQGKTIGQGIRFLQVAVPDGVDDAALGIS